MDLEFYLLQYETEVDSFVTADQKVSSSMADELRLNFAYFREDYYLKFTRTKVLYCNYQHKRNREEEPSITKCLHSILNLNLIIILLVKLLLSLFNVQSIPIEE